MWVDDHDNHNEPDPIPYSNIMVTPNDENYAKLDRFAIFCEFY